MKKLNRKGFTLIELLAVIVILAIVLVVTIPSVLSTMNDAKEKQLQNINEILQAVQNLKDQLNSVPQYKDESQKQIDERKKLEGQKSEHIQTKTGLQEDLNNINEQINYLETENKKFSDKKDGQGKSNFDRTVEQRTAELIQKEKEKLPEGIKIGRAHV